MHNRVPLLSRPATPARSCAAQSSLALTLLSDLGAPLPHDFFLDFQVDGFDVSEVRARGEHCLAKRVGSPPPPHSGGLCAQDGQGYLTVLVDNDVAVHSHGNRVEVRGLPAGHHFLRAVLVDSSSDTCLKSPMAFVEAEFYVVSFTGETAAHPR